MQQTDSSSRKKVVGSCQTQTKDMLEKPVHCLCCHIEDEAGKSVGFGIHELSELVSISR